MSKNREIEAKTILSQSVYQALCHAFALKKNFSQTNYYFDTTNGLLKDLHISCRIRTFSDHAEQTLKVPDTRPVQKQFHEVIEINDQLTLTQAKALLTVASNTHITFSGNIGTYFQQNLADKLEKKPLQLQTWSKTNRTLLNGPHNCELTLDATSYPDNFTDYELEIENSDHQLIASVLRQLEEQFDFNSTANNTNQNKIARAFAHRKS